MNSLIIYHGHKIREWNGEFRVMDGQIVAAILPTIKAAKQFIRLFY